MSLDPIARLRDAGPKLSATVRQSIVALGAAAVPELITLLEDDGWPAIHAVDLLVDLRAAEAVAPMLAVLRESSSDDRISDRIVMRLPKLGGAALEPTLAIVDDVGEEQRGGVFEILAKLGVRDERIFEALRRAFEKEGVDGLWPGLLADYGDARFLPLIERLLAAYEPDFTRLWSRVELTELLDAHERLGGRLPRALEERVEEWQAMWNAEMERYSSPAPVVRRKIGRNEPCPCGSGKKYKKCCIDAREPPEAGAAGPTGR